MNEERKRQYFAELAPNYADLTSNTTQDVFAMFLESYGAKLNLTSSSVIHDNASGPGTATQVLVQHATNTGITPQIVATDYAANMIEELLKLKSREISSNPVWNNVTATVLNSSDLSNVPDNHFSHSTSNFSLFTVTEAVKSLRETYRTLQPGGTAVILLWKRFTIESLLAAAQDHIKGPGYAAAHAVPVNGPQYYQKATVPDQLVEAGFDASKIETWQMDIVVLESDEKRWDGVFKFMTSTSVSAGSTRGWTESEVRAWKDAARWAMSEESKKSKTDGIKFEAWINVVRK